MTKIEALVTDLETSKQLQEAGIVFETAFVWVYIYPNKLYGIKKGRYELKPRKEYAFADKIIPAFTAGEMMQVFPQRVIFNGKKYFLQIGKTAYKDIFAGYYLRENIFDKAISFIGKEALAKLCLWCRQEGYL